MFFKAPQFAFAAAFALMSTFMSTWASTGFAQEISASHLSAARKALSATQATLSFDAILVNASAGLKNQLTAANPDQADKISAIVDEEALALAPRRGDLEGEAARLFANTFTEAELNELATFFSSTAGKKYLGNTPILARELSKSARVWANGISRDLNVNVKKKLTPEGN